MAYTRKQLITCISIVYLIIATVLSGYAASQSSKLAIPIPSTLTGFTTALPIVAGVLLEAGYDLTRRQERRKGIAKGDTTRPPLVIIANTLIFIYSSVVITLLGTHVGPTGDINCGLERSWRDMFRHKDDETIRTIQDAFKCCGLINSHDQAWPFPDKDHKADACEKQFGRTRGCFGPWRGTEQRMAGVLMGVVGLVFIWQFSIIAIPTQRESWLHQVLPDRISRFVADEEHGTGSNGVQRAIGYVQGYNRYSDRVTSEHSDSEEEEEGQRPRRIDEAQESQNNLPSASRDELADNQWVHN
ncbi:hypothetical protein P154DRAFT_518682 [Amniculicola lignicola CBS 123094]|uniref:Tetraspanin Tsp3 n=1 Tax=Amniculicola lignicola CBS 123094 TaxID=1392246 RepID=A0A6A5WVY6_9PLEO|nr:hypothetical protein P154DRAFT_518682 [Amniculicola lignicola CBS 123094]